MRVGMMVTFLALLAGPALAQGWQEYRYPDLGFSISFPAEPKITDVAAKAPDGAALTRKIFSVSEAGADFRIAVTDYSASSIADNVAIDQAADMLRAKGEVLVDVAARVNRNFGRELSIAGKDGSRSVAAIFFVDHRLYELEGLLQPERATSADAMRFQQSLNFSGGPGGFPGRAFRFGQNGLQPGGIP